jgi:hypothetical protein
MLPVEAHIVAAARALEAAKARCDQALLQLQYTPRDRAGVFDTLNALSGCVQNAAGAYTVYSEVLVCQGQA